jgi:hypothetical protein
LGPEIGVDLGGGTAEEWCCARLGTFGKKVLGTVRSGGEWDWEGGVCVAGAGGGLRGVHVIHPGSD